MPAPVPALLLITDPALGPDLLPAVEAALRAARPGRLGVQLRSKEANGRELVALGRALRARTRTSGAVLLVNGRLDVAKIVEADGVHLPETGVSVGDARALLGPDRLVGRSCHDAEGLATAADAGADYVTLSPVLAVPGKAPALGLAGFAAICRNARLPVLALGGIGPDLVPDILAAGAHGVAVLRAIGGPDRAEANTRALLAPLDRSGATTR